MHPGERAGAIFVIAPQAVIEHRPPAAIAAGGYSVSIQSVYSEYTHCIYHGIYL